MQCTYPAFYVVYVLTCSARLPHRLPHSPAIIAMVRSDADVSAVVRFARLSSLEVAVRSGGHSIRGFSTGDGVLVVNLACINEVWA